MRHNSATPATVETGGRLDTQGSGPVFAAPRLSQRLASVWFRHLRVYSQNLLSNAVPPFLEPLIFLVGLGLGLGRYVDSMAGLPYVEYLAAGLMMTASMFTASFECTFGTYIRMEFDKAYDGMLGAPISARDLLVGEILWAGATKGFAFSASVLLVTAAFGVVSLSQYWIAPFIGSLTGLMFAVLGFLVTSLVKNINQFNFFFSAFISPMFFFAGVVFPLENLPAVVRPVAELLPLTHTVRMLRMFTGSEAVDLRILGWDALYVGLLIFLVGAWGIKRLTRKLID